MTANGLAQLFTHMNYLWGDPIEADKDLARDWFKALSAVDDDAVLEALPILAQSVDRRPSIAQLVQQAKACVAARPVPPQLTEGKHISPYTQAWMRLLQAWREGRIEPAVFLPVADRHALYFRSGNSTAAAAMVEESEALLQYITPRASTKQEAQS